MAIWALGKVLCQKITFLASLAFSKPPGAPQKSQISPKKWFNAEHFGRVFGKSAHFFPSVAGVF
jgi:hypothetical protein